MLKSIVGILAASSWWLLALITAMGLTLGKPGNLTINLSMAIVFCLVGTFLIWRTRTLVKLRRAHPVDPIVIILLRAQLVSDLAMALLGLALTSAAGFRIWREALPVFG